MGTKYYDSLIDGAARNAVEYDYISTSLLERKLEIGYARAESLMDQLEELKIIGPYNGGHARKVLVHDFKKYKKLKIRKRKPTVTEGIYNSFVIKDRAIFPKISQFSLYLTVLLVIIGQFSIKNHDIRVLYSLCMVIASSLSKYGTNISFYITKFPEDEKHVSDRWWGYVVLWVFGIIGIISTLF